MLLLRNVIWVRSVVDVTAVNWATVVRRAVIIRSTFDRTKLGTVAHWSSFRTMIRGRGRWWSMISHMRRCWRAKRLT